MLLVSNNISDSVLSTLVYNLRKGIIEAYPLIIKEYGTQAQLYFKELTKLTGATLFDNYGPCPIQEARFEHLGSAVRVEMDEI